MEEIHTKTCLRFVPVKDENIDFLLIMKPLTRGCSSFVGKRGEYSFSFFY